MTLLPERGESPIRIAAKCALIAILAIVAVIALFFAFEIVRLIVDPSARE